MCVRERRRRKRRRTAAAGKGRREARDSEAFLPPLCGAVIVKMVLLWQNGEFIKKSYCSTVSTPHMEVAFELVGSSTIS